MLVMKPAIVILRGTPGCVIANKGPTMSNDCKLPHIINSQLDALDRVLLSLLPREERLAIVSQVEARSSQLENTGTYVQGDASASTESSIRPVMSGNVRIRRGKRSRLALASGILGIVAISLLVALPIGYFVVAIFSDVLDEFRLILMLGMHVSAIGVFGTAAFVFGLLALWRLGYRPNARGKAWAITGVCTGPVPMMTGCAMLLVIAPIMHSASVQDSAMPLEIHTPVSGYFPGANRNAVGESSPNVPASTWIGAPNFGNQTVGVVCPHCNEAMRVGNPAAILALAPKTPSCNANYTPSLTPSTSQPPPVPAVSNPEETVTLPLPPSSPQDNSPASAAG